MSTISSVLYANQNHPELKVDYPQWQDRYKQIMKKWRALSSDKKAPYLQRARDNRSAQQAQLRTKKAQQVSMIVSHQLIFGMGHIINFLLSRYFMRYWLILVWRGSTHSSFTHFHNCQPLLQSYHKVIISTLYFLSIISVSVGHIFSLTNI